MSPDTRTDFFSPFPFIPSVLITGIYDSSLTVLNAFGIYALIVTSAFAVTGLFFGLLGYIAHHMFFEDYPIEVFIFRDYWSNVYNLGKNNKREYNDLDRRLNNIHLLIKDWWKNLIWRARKPKPELVFVPQMKADSSLHKNKKNYRIGDVFEINSGKHLFSEVIDPSDLVAAYRPSVLNIPAISNHIGGGRKLAFEEVVSRFLGWFIDSKFLWVLYLSLSVMLGFFSLNYFSEYSEKHGIMLIQSDITNIIIICVLVSDLAFSCGRPANAHLPILFRPLPRGARQLQRLVRQHPVRTLTRGRSAARIRAHRLRFPQGSKHARSGRPAPRHDAP